MKRVLLFIMVSASCSPLTAFAAEPKVRTASPMDASPVMVVLAIAAIYFFLSGMSKAKSSGGPTSVKGFFSGIGDKAKSLVTGAGAGAAASSGGDDYSTPSVEAASAEPAADTSSSFETDIVNSSADEEDDFF